VTSLSGGTISTTFTYDANGNQTAGLGRSITYSSYNKPASITQGTQTISFLDDTEHQRFQQVTPSGTTLYIAGFGVLAELSGAGTSAAQWTDYLAVGNAKVGMRVLQTASETLSTRYFHTDHLGSISVIMDESGNVLERLSYDAWGKRRFPNGSDDSSGSITSQTTRGFTGEEELSVSGLVHLNGRVYDPLLARFTSADPTVTDPTNPQGWNRYSYVGNDPLAFTDPNGFSWLSGFFHSVGKFFGNVANFLRNNSIARAILQIGATVLLNVALPGLGFAVGSLSLAVASAAGGAAIAAGLSGGNLGQVLKAGLIAGLTAAAFFEVGDLTYGPAHASPAFDSPNFNAGNFAENVAGHALVGCASSVAWGGSCKSGALSGAVTAGAGPLINNPYSVQSLVANAVLGGLASVAGGGKFANGAVTGAFGYLFNDLAHMLVGSDAHYQLTSYLQRRDPGLWDDGNTTLGGIFGSGRPDLIYDSMPRNVFEIKPQGSDAAGNAQLTTYLNSPGAQAVAGDYGLIFKGADAPSFTLTGGWFGEARYTYSPSAYYSAGVVIYSVSSGTFEAVGGLIKTPNFFPLPPRLPPIVVP
jgi:RHS repeat-associated protein